MVSDFAPSESVLLFANRCQAGVGAWVYAADLASRLAATWDSLKDVPNDGQRSTPIVARIVLGFAEHLGGGQHAHSMSAPSSSIRSVSRVKVIRALALILATYDDQCLCLASVGAHVGISGGHLSRIVSKESGHGFETHLHGIRVLKATLLLRDTLFSMGEVSDKVGYGTLTNFDRHFQHWLRISPTEFRLASARRF